MENLQIKIKYHTSENEGLQPVQHGDWIDLRSAEDVILKCGDFKVISLGVSMKLPKGYEAHIVPRSSTYKKWGVIQANHMGVIDENYCGEHDVWGFPAIAIRPAVIHKGDRICQFRIVKKMPPVSFLPVDHMEDQDRGGFGSTGAQ